MKNLLVKREHKGSKIIIFLIILVASYYSLRVCSYIELKGDGFQFSYLTDVLNNLWKVTEPLVLTPKNILISLFIGMFTWMVIATYLYQNKRNVQEDTYGNSDWEDSKATLQYRDKKYENNQIFTATEMFSKDMKISKRFSEPFRNPQESFFTSAIV